MCCTKPLFDVNFSVNFVGSLSDYIEFRWQNNIGRADFDLVLYKNGVQYIREEYIITTSGLVSADQTGSGTFEFNRNVDFKSGDRFYFKAELKTDRQIEKI